MPQELHKLLKQYWGYDAFRPLQEDIIASVLDGTDTLALLPTGGGKSLCYQLPAVAMEGICLVVSPLISLMKDQVQRLTDIGIRAACLVSGMTPKEQEVVLNNCLYGNRKVKVLYVSPERLRSRPFIEHYRQMKVSLIAVDEAHCISQWGYDFRPPYLEIATIRQYHPSAPILALTATATTKVVNDIQEKLQFRQGKLFQTSFARNNISFLVFREEDKMNRLLRMATHVQGSGIVYVRNRRSTQDVATFLQGKGISATYYHAGLNAKERDLRQAMWMSDKVRVMVATNAFGMGIDKPDVSFVAHLDIPSSLEAYYQEAGRAGRDGRRAYATVLYDNNDIERLRQNYHTKYPPLQKIANIYRGLCNYYQLPVGSGADRAFPLDISNICTTYGFSVGEFYAAVQFLQHEGLVFLPDREEVESRVFIPASREDVYRFQVENRRYGDLLKLLLRMYGGMFSDFVPIDEAAIARKTYTQEPQIIKMLQHLDAMKIISYKKKCSGPTICFPSERIDASLFQYKSDFYEQQKVAESERIKAVLHYVKDDRCRVAMLLAYFDETVETTCGECDYCLQHKASRPSRPISEMVLEVVQTHGPLSVKEVAMHLSSIPVEELQHAVRTLLDTRQIGMNADFMLVV